MNLAKKNIPETRDFVAKEPMGLLEFLITQYPNLSRNNVKSLLSRKQVSLNGRPTTAFDAPLVKGDKVTVSRYGAREAKPLPFKIVYEDDEFVAIDKPSGLLSVSDDRETEYTAFNLTYTFLKSLNIKTRLYVVHRIDKDTSGLLIFSKNPEVRDALQEHWNDLVTRRGYFAIVEGRLSKKDDTLKANLRETSTRLVFVDHEDEGGKEAITHYHVMGENDEFSLLDVSIETGRKNQIRAQFHDFGHDIIGDDKYHAKKDPLNRLGLHAYSLEFKHPFSGHIKKFYAPIPKTFKTLFPETKSAKKE